MRTSRLVAHAAIAGLLLSSSVIGAPIALAQPPVVSNVNASTITQDHGALTIHKRLNPESYGTNPTGTEADVASAKGDPVEGVPFQLHKVTGFQLEGNAETTDLTSNEGYAKANKFAQEYAKAENKREFLNQFATLDQASSQTKTTNAAGEAKFENLPLGLYLVEELSAADYPTTIKVNGEEINGVIAPSAPYLVFLPMTDPTDGSKWNFDIHSVPKNSSVGIDKKIEDYQTNKGYNAGDVLKYTINTDIPRVEPGQTIRGYEISDTLPKEVTFTDANLANLVVEIEGTQLANGADYTVEGVNTPQVRIVFTDAGRDKLVQNGGKKVKVTLPATINTPEVADVDVADTPNPIGNDGTDVNDGVAVNRAVLTFTNDAGYRAEVESNSVKSRWGNLRILKTDPQKANSGESALDGAKFELYRCADQDTPLGDKITINGKSEWTSGEDGAKGLINIKGLQVTDLLNNESIANGEEAKYCLKETKAPEGYELSPKMHVIEFKEEDLDNADPVTIAGVQVDNDRITQTAEVVNVTKTSSFLPNTGGAGIGILMAIGAAIIGAGLWAAKRMSRKA